MSYVPGTVVCFQDQGVPRLGIITATQGSRFEIIDTSGVTSKFSQDRFTVFPGLPIAADTTVTGIQKHLNDVISDAIEAAAHISLGKVWVQADSLNSPVSSEDIFNLCKIEPKSDLTYLGFHILLLEDKVYFKQRGQFFLRRSEEEVDERIRQAEELKQQVQRIETMIELVVQVASGKIPQPERYPDEINYLAELAALGNDAPDSKQSRLILETIESRLGIKSTDSDDVRAFALLVSIGHFGPDENLSLIRLGLNRIAQPALASIAEKISNQASTEYVSHSDLTALDCFTIDGKKTGDFDDALSIESLPDGNFRVGVHITDVWSALHTDVDTFDLALHEAISIGTSIYLPDQTINMLPSELSENFLSLRAGNDRFAVSMFATFNPAGKEVDLNFSLSRIKISRNYTYDEANDLLTNTRDTPLWKLWSIAAGLQQNRLSRPSYSFDRQELVINVSDAGAVSLSNYENDTPAHLIVSELAILYNSEMAELGKTHRLPFLYRSQAAPEEDPATVGLDIPAGPARDNYQRSVFQRTVTDCRPFPHTGLGLDCYLQATSPLRRAVDLLNQGQLVSYLSRSKAFYPAKKMLELFREIEPAIDRANIAQRERIRYFLLKYLEVKKDQPLSGVIAKIEHGQCYVELTETLLLTQFEPRSPIVSNAQAKLQLGREIALEITEIAPKSGILRLSER